MRKFYYKRTLVSTGTSMVGYTTAPHWTDFNTLLDEWNSGATCWRYDEISDGEFEARRNESNPFGCAIRTLTDGRTELFYYVKK